MFKESPFFTSFFTTFLLIVDTNFFIVLFFFNAFIAVAVKRLRKKFLAFKNTIYAKLGYLNDNS